MVSRRSRCRFGCAVAGPALAASRSAVLAALPLLAPAHTSIIDMSSSTIYPDLPEIRVTLDSGVATVWLSRPAQRNAFTNEMKNSLVEAYHRLDEDDKVRVVVLAGDDNPGKAFCAGASPLSSSPRLACC